MLPYLINYDLCMVSQENAQCSISEHAPWPSTICQRQGEPHTNNQPNFIYSIIMSAQGALP